MCVSIEREGEPLDNLLLNFNTRKNKTTKLFQAEKYQKMFWIYNSLSKNYLFVKISAFDKWLRNCVATRETTYEERGQQKQIELI